MQNNNLSENARAFINILASLKEQERLILIDRFYHRRTMQSVAKKLNLTQTRINQIEDKVIEKIDQIFNYINL